MIATRSPRATPSDAKPEREIADALEQLLARQPVDLSARQRPIEHRLRKPSHDVKRQVGDGVDVDVRARQLRRAAVQCVTA